MKAGGRRTRQEEVGRAMEVMRGVRMGMSRVGKEQEVRRRDEEGGKEERSGARGWPFKHSPLLFGMLFLPL